MWKYDLGTTIVQATLNVPYLQPFPGSVNKRPSVWLQSTHKTATDLVCCCYDYQVDAQLQYCVVHCILRLFGCVMSNACSPRMRVLTRLPQEKGRRPLWRNIKGTSHHFIFKFYFIPYLLIFLHIQRPLLCTNISTKTVLQKWYIQCKRAK